MSLIITGGKYETTDSISLPTAMQYCGRCIAHPSGIFEQGMHSERDCSYLRVSIAPPCTNDIIYPISSLANKKSLFREIYFMFPAAVAEMFFMTLFKAFKLLPRVMTQSRYLF